MSQELPVGPRSVAQRYADRAGPDEGDALVPAVLRTGSVAARDILAEAAWPGHDMADVLAWCRSGSPWPVLAEGMDPGRLGDLGHVVAVQTQRQEDREDGRRILEALGHDETLRQLTPRAAGSLLQLRVGDRDHAAAAELLDHPAVRRSIKRGIRAAVRTDLRNPYLFPDEPGADEADWLVLLNRALHAGRLTDLALLPPGQLPDGTPLPVFDRLVAPDRQEVPSPHRVTVLMSAHRPGHAVITAVRSIIEQTWTNWELFVIDDGSGCEFDPILAQVAGMDPRVQVIRKPVNGGTYRARNTALRRATGEFVTALDSDDYFHPQALEQFLAPLLAEPGLLATRCNGVRLVDQVGLTRLGYVPRMVAGSTLTFRRVEVLERIGFFDTVPKGADNEYRQRLVAAFGPRVRDLPSAMLLMRSGTTLSSSDFRRGWQHGTRFAYKTTYAGWHAGIAAGTADPFLDPDGPRPFPDPLGWRSQAAARRRFDLCVVGDWRTGGQPHGGMLARVHAALEGGYSVALVHLESLWETALGDVSLCGELLDLVRAGHVEWIQLDDPVDLGVVLVDRPEVLQFAPPGPGTLRADRVVCADSHPGVGTERYAVGDVAARVGELFGAEPEWAPQDLAATVLPAPSEHPELSASRWGEGSRWVALPAMVGVPGTGEPTDLGPDLEVRDVVGGEGALRRALQELDFLLLPEQVRGDPVRLTLESLAAGTLVVADPVWRAVLGDLPDYLPPEARPAQVTAALEHYARRPRTYARRLARARQAVWAVHGPQAFRDLLASWLAEPAERRVTPAGAAAGRSTGTGWATAMGTDTGTGQDAALRLVVRAAARPAGGPPEVSVPEGYVGTTLTLRAAWDGERADHVVIVHLPRSEAEVTDWVHDTIGQQGQGPVPDGTWHPRLDAAPEGVAAVVVRRDGLLSAAARDGVVLDLPTDQGGPWWALQQPGVRAARR